jgi:DNA gyrase/topoisomerase IV subunit B
MPRTKKEITNWLDAKVEDKYSKKGELEHILELPDTQIGSTEFEDYNFWIPEEDDNDDVAFSKKDIRFTPGLYKIIDEILVNAYDQTVRLKEIARQVINKENPDEDDYIESGIDFVKNIKIDIDMEEGYISVCNDGEGVDVDIHKVHKVYVPQLIFGDMRTSSNYNKKETGIKIVGGRNGFGAKLANIFSTRFIVETVDGRRGKHFRQEYEKNMSKRHEPEVKNTTKKAFTRITFYPDLKRFGYDDGMDDSLYNLVLKRAYDLAACTEPNINVYLNDEKIDCKNFEKYVSYYLGDKKQYPRIYKQFNNRWEVVACISPNQKFEQVSFANGVSTIRGGKHVEYVSKQIVSKLKKYIEIKKKIKTLKSEHVKDNIMVFVKCSIDGAAFDTQTKECLTTTSGKFGSVCEIDDAFIQTLAEKCGVMEQVYNWHQVKSEINMKKTDGSNKRTHLNIPKLEDAGWAGGGKKAQLACLILTEGDSAKTLAMSGRSAIKDDAGKDIGNDMFGVFPLRGKVMNVDGASAEKIMNNAEITHLKQILGLQEGKEYKNTKSLRYGSILIMCDQDSVTGDTPLLLNDNDGVKINVIENLVDDDDFITFGTGKEYAETNKEIWTDKGWTKIKKVIRHKVNKRMYRILTHTGIVDVTEDHSLLRENGQEISPKDCNIDDMLLHSFPMFENHKYVVPNDFESLSAHEIHPIASKCDIQKYQTLSKSILIEKIKEYQNTPIANLKTQDSMSLEEAWLAGFWWADGTAGIYNWKYNKKPVDRPNEYSFDRTSYNWSITNKDLKLLEKAKSLAEKVYPGHDFNIITGKCNSQIDSDVIYKLIINGGIKTMDICQKYIDLFYIKTSTSKYQNGNKYIPPLILNNSERVRYNFLDGYYSGDGYTHDLNNKLLCFDVESKISSQCLFMLCKSLGYKVSINHQDRKMNCYTLTITTGKQQDNPCRIKKIFDLGTTEQYVYDLETENHHFQAGIGQMIVHNTDGSHIKGLLINLFKTKWPSLLNVEGFMTSLLTPIVKATKGKSVKSFYSLPQFEKWLGKNNNGKGYSIKYYKGLGTSTKKEAKEYFEEFKKNIYTMQENTIDKIGLAFDKKRADDRKEWLKVYDRDETLDYSESHISFDDFIDKDLKHFSHEDNRRSIPSMIDGFKESQRKILFGIKKRGHISKTGIKVAQIGAYIAEHSGYHHGEQSIYGTIINMAQTFVGSNNINLLEPLGQFGSRLQGGKDFASPRYIFTRMEEISEILYDKRDDPLHTYLVDDGQNIEPEFYAPIIPTILINGCQGIGTGFSTSIPCHNPLDVIKSVRKLLAGKPISDLTPWYRGFKGFIIKSGPKTYLTKGIYKVLDSKTVEISELPIGVWTENYKNMLYRMAGEKVVTKSPKKKEDDNKKAKPIPKLLKKIVESNSDSTVKFTLTFEDDILEQLLNGAPDKRGINLFEKTFKLSSSLSINNMHLYDSKHCLRKYKSTSEIIEEFCIVRQDLYIKRRKYFLDKLKKEKNKLSWKAKFIMCVISDDDEEKIFVNKRSKKNIHQQLEKKNFPKEINDELVKLKDIEKIEDSDNDKAYNYLLSMPIYSLTQELIDKLLQDKTDKETEYDILKAKSPIDLWNEDLAELEKAYTKFTKNYWVNEGKDAEIEYNAVAERKKKTHKKFKAKKGAELENEGIELENEGIELENE